MSKQKKDYGTQYSDVNIKCPFYKAANDKKRTLICEGAESGTQIRFSLRQGERYQRYRERYCEGDFESCPYYRAADRKYIEEAEGK